jgi:Cytosol aminopeptidase family, N-terminal domain
MKHVSSVFAACLILALGSVARATPSTPKQHVFETKPLGMKVAIKMIGPYGESADLQIICLFRAQDRRRHGSGRCQGYRRASDGNTLGLTESRRVRWRARWDDSFHSAQGSIPAKRFMVIGLGEEKDLSLDSLRLVGRVAAREAVRLRAKHVAWAPVIRDQGNSTLDVGEGDRAFAEQMILAYDTERRLQAQGLGPPFAIETVVIEAGPTYFDGAVERVGEGISAVAAELGQRNAAPYATVSK